MTANEKLRLAYASYVFRHPGQKSNRKKFSELLGLPIQTGGRTSTLDKWLVDEESNNFRQCPESMARFAAVAVILEACMKDLENCQPLSDEDFFAIRNALHGISPEREKPSYEQTT